MVFGQRSQLWWDVPVADSFELLKDIYRIDDAVYRKNREELTELLNLSELLRTPTRQLSLGQRMRCEIAASLLHSPRLLFLDEPTIEMCIRDRVYSTADGFLEGPEDSGIRERLLDAVKFFQEAAPFGFVGCLLYTSRCV